MDDPPDPPTIEPTPIDRDDAEQYDRIRPSYPEELIDDVVDLTGLPCNAIDIMCGTGIATAMLAQRGVTGVAVEPHTAMAEVARRKLTGHDGWRVDVSDFERWRPQPGDAPFDLAISAQAWHWLAPDTRLHTAHHLVRPGGWIAVWWNSPGHDDSQVRRDLNEVYAVHAPAIARFGTDLTLFNPDSVRTLFHNIHERTYHWSQTYTADQWTALLRTSSSHRLLSEEQRNELLAAVHRVVDEHGGHYTQPYVCQLWYAQRP